MVKPRRGRGLGWEDKAWLRVYQLLAYAPDLNSAGHLVATQAGMANVAAVRPEGLVRIVKRKLEKLQYRP